MCMHSNKTDQATQDVRPSEQLHWGFLRDPEYISIEIIEDCRFDGVLTVASVVSIGGGRWYLRWGQGVEI